MSYAREMEMERREREDLALLESGNVPEPDDELLLETVANLEVKSGYLWRQSRMLKKWKRSWFVLWNSGRLMFYEDEYHTVAKDAINIPFERATILSSEDCVSERIEPPSLVRADCLFGVETGNKTWFLAANYPEEMDAWRNVLIESRDKGWAKFIDSPSAYTFYYPHFPRSHHRSLHGMPQPIVAKQVPSAFNGDSAMGYATSAFFIGALFCPFMWCL